jgi:hypothetical protein
MHKSHFGLIASLSFTALGIMVPVRASCVEPAGGALQQSNAAMAETNGVRLAIGTAKSVYAAGAPIFLSVTITNSGKSDSLMVRSNPSLILLDDIVVRYADGKPVPQTLYWKYQMQPHIRHDSWGSLGPGLETGAAYLLNLYFDMTLREDYAVFVRAIVWDGGKDIQVVSPSLTIKVQGEYARY